MERNSGVVFFGGSVARYKAAFDDYDAGLQFSKRTMTCMTLNPEIYWQSSECLRSSAVALALRRFSQDEQVALVI